MRIELQGVTVQRKGRSILREVDATFEAGRMTVILGRSGAGLSTLLKTAAGLVQPTRGRVLYDGQALDTLDNRQMLALQTRTGFMFQDAALWANADLATNLDLPLRTRFPDLDTDARRRIVDTALNSLGFTADLKQRPAMLSQGQQKTVSFLRAMIPGPEALFLDEPMASMDRQWRDVLIRILGELREHGVALIAVSHDVELTRALADDVVVMHEGRVLASGPSAAVRASTEPVVRDILCDRFEPDCHPTE